MDLIDPGSTSAANFGALAHPADALAAAMRVLQTLSAHLVAHSLPHWPG